MYIYPEKISRQNLIFKTASQFELLTFSEADNWCFSFANGIYVNVEGGLWRLLRDNKIVKVSYDHEQKFGLSAPLNLTKTVTEILNGKYLTKMEVVETTGDLLLSISDSISIEIFITSSGYESYSFAIDKKRYVGMGSGEISMHYLK